MEVGVACLDVADDDHVSADPGASDPAEGVLVPDVVDQGASDPAGGVIVPDVVEPTIRPSVDREGAGRGVLDVIGPSGGSGETFEVLTDVDGSIVVRLMGELDLSTVPELEAAVGRVISARGGRLVLDARDLDSAIETIPRRASPPHEIRPKGSLGRDRRGWFCRRRVAAPSEAGGCRAVLAAPGLRLARYGVAGFSLSTRGNPRNAFPLYRCGHCGFATTAFWDTAVQAHAIGCPECAGEVELVTRFDTPEGASRERGSVQSITGLGGVASIHGDTADGPL